MTVPVNTDPRRSALRRLLTLVASTAATLAVVGPALAEGVTVQAVPAAEAAVGNPPAAAPLTPGPDPSAPDVTPASAPEAPVPAPSSAPEAPVAGSPGVTPAEQPAAAPPLAGIVRSLPATESAPPAEPTTTPAPAVTVSEGVAPTPDVAPDRPAVGPQLDAPPAPAAGNLTQAADAPPASAPASSPARLPAPVSRPDALPDAVPSAALPAASTTRVSKASPAGRVPDVGPLTERNATSATPIPDAVSAVVMPAPESFAVTGGNVPDRPIAAGGGFLQLLVAWVAPGDGGGAAVVAPLIQLLFVLVAWLLIRPRPMRELVSLVSADPASGYRAVVFRPG